MQHTMIIPNRLYQRGQTWKECQESWEPERELLQRRMLDARHLPILLTRLQTCSADTRIIIYHNPWLHESARTLPLLGQTLTMAGKSAHFFEEDIFFGTFFEAFGRQVPKVMLLSPEGTIQRAWGPRPTDVQSAIQNHQGKDLDNWYNSLDDTNFVNSLDKAISTALFDRTYPPILEYK